MSTTGGTRDARRRRILQKGEDRLALITGRKPNLSSDNIDNFNSINSDASSPPLIPNQQQSHHHDSRSNPPSVSRAEEDKSTSSMHDQAPSFTQDDANLGLRTKEESIPSKKPERVIGPPRPSASEDNRIKAEHPSAAQKVLETALGLVNRIPIKNITSQQVGIAVLETENDRLLCAITLAILVVLSYAGLPLLSSSIFRGILLFRPLFLVIIINITFIIRRLLPENRRQLTRDNKEANSLLLGDGYAWAEEAGRALELGLMLQNITGALFVDCSVYATIVVFGLSLFG